MDLPFKLCKIGLKNTLFIFGRKMFVCCFVVVLLLFVATLSDFSLLFFLIEALIELRKRIITVFHRAVFNVLNVFKRF